MSEHSQPERPAERPDERPASGGPTSGPPARVVVSERAHPASPLVHLWIGVVAIAWFVVQELLPGNSGRLRDLSHLGQIPFGWLIVFAGVGLGLLAGYWGWWTTKFVIDDRELRIENTGAFTESKRIAFSRIQSVDLTQPFAARLLGLAELTVDVGADASTKLSFLTRRRADEIRGFLLERARASRASGGPGTPAPGTQEGPGTQEASGVPAQPEPQGTPGQPGGHSVPGPDLSGVPIHPGAPAASPHPPTAAGAPGRAAASRWSDLSAEDRVLIRLNPGELIVGALLSVELWLLVLALVVPVVIGVWIDEPVLVGGGFIPMLLAIGGFLMSRVVNQFNYTLADTHSGLRITRGLTSLRSQTIPVHRVQSIKISQPILWRWLKRYKVDVAVLGLAIDGEGNTSTLLLPIGDARQVDIAVHSVWPGLDLRGLRFSGPAPRARWLDPLTYRWMGYAQNDEVVVTRGGWFSRRETIVPHARLQSAHLHQGPLDRRWGLASVTFDTTELLGGNVVGHLDADRARALVFDEMARAKHARTSELFVPDRAASGSPSIDAAAPGPAQLPAGPTPAHEPAEAPLPAVDTDDERRAPGQP